MDADFTVRLVLASAFVGVMLLSLRWILPLVLRSRGTAPGGLMAIVASTTLAPNSGMHVVRVGEQFFMVGTGHGQVTMLGELDADCVRSRVPERGATPQPTSQLFAWIAKNARR